MSRELSELYRSLAADADARDLGLPDVLRHQADRRARFRAAGSTLAVGLVVVGVVIGAQVITPPPASVPAPAGTPTPSASPSPSATGGSPSPSVSPTTPDRSPGTAVTVPGGTGTQQPRTPTRIPDRAFFALAPANQIGIAPEFRDVAALPGLCGADIPSEAAVHRRTRLLTYKLPQNPGEGYVPDGTYTHSIAIYRAGRADDVLKELRQAVRDCPDQKRPGDSSVRSRQRLLPDSGFGDESVLFEMRSAGQDVNGDPTGVEDVRLVRAIRIGDVVTILWEQGWENTSSQRAQVDADSRRAVAAIRSWLG
ncbi:hypothetical protein [Micromonospora ureilytica]|uniref:PknH-like extracellular domain-containing protein n=1 Tax=Micromonospora ureilytica TaxID=709868 RepID=A0ABS0JTK3_9ACTN|nr:hypothetical protein [Micromonospora ureilytica]MBG6069791.1 hypothetical protein [Micromonospora ureilytica]WSR56975.1 hypothetical protein OG400_01770 [Micromonospora ureilytica]